MSVLYVRDENGKLVPIYTIKGDKGEKGDPYILTEADKTEIVNSVIEALPKYNGEVVEV